MWIPNPTLYFPSNHSLTTNVQFPCLWTDLNKFFFFDFEIWWGFQIWYCTFPKWLSGPQKSNFLVSRPIWIIFFLRLENLMGIPNPILYFLQITLWRQKSNFFVYGPIWIIFFLWLWNSMGIPNPILYFPPNDFRATKVKFP